MDLLDLKLFFMFDKSIQGVQKVKELIRAASKHGADKQVIQGKLQRIDEKMDELKEQLTKDNQAHQKIVKNKEKQIRKGMQRERLLEEKLQQSKLKSKKSSGVGRTKRDFPAGGFENRSLSMNESEVLEAEIRNKKQVEQKLQQSQRQLAQLKQKMIEKQRENQRLREQIQIQRLLIWQFENQKSEVSSQQQNCTDFDEQGAPSHPISIEMNGSRSQMMDMSQGGNYPSYQQELQPRKMSEDQQTDDEQEQDEFYSKMISKVSETESIDIPQVKQINSIQSQTDYMEKNSEHKGAIAQQQADLEAAEKNQQIIENKSEIKSEGKSVENEHEKSEQNVESGKKSWFSWQNWFRKSKK